MASGDVVFSAPGSRVTADSVELATRSTESVSLVPSTKDVHDHDHGGLTMAGKTTEKTADYVASRQLYVGGKHVRRGETFSATEPVGDKLVRDRCAVPAKAREAESLQEEAPTQTPTPASANEVHEDSSGF